jgi:hypothetical protein
MKQKSMRNKHIKIGAIVFCALLLLFILPFFIPMITNFLFGNKIINTHIEKTYTKNASLQQNIDESFKWLNHSYIPYGEDRLFPLFGSKNGFYKVENKTILFIRPSFVSWFILTKTGNCGEHADYLTEIFERLGYNVRKVSAVGGDHAIIQVIENNVSFFIDPSSKTVIENTNYFENGQWARIIAITPNGTEIDLTNDILKNKSKVTLFKNTSVNIKSTLRSTYLMNRSIIYKKPILVYQFNLVNNSDSIIVSSGEDYIIEYYHDFFIFKFSVEKNLNLTKDVEIYTNDVSITLKNFKLTLIGCFIILVLCLILPYSGQLYRLFIKLYNKLFPLKK